MAARRAAVLRGGRPLSAAPIGVLIGVLIGASTVTAQTPPAPPSASAAPAPTTPVSPLTVEGASRATLQKQAHDFVESYAQPTKKLNHLARWNEPACVAVTGLAATQAAQFKGLIEVVAKQVQAPVGGPKCTPNIEIAFTKEPQRTVIAAAARNKAVLGEDGAQTVTRPIQAWYATATWGAGAEVPGLLSEGPPPSPIQGGYIGRVAGDRLKATNGTEAARRCVDPGVAAHNPKVVSPEFQFFPDRVGTPTMETDVPCPHSTFLNVLIVVDVAHMGDVSVDLTADYLALVALSQPKPRALDGCLALPSVLDLYAKDCPGRELPTGLTGADKACLTGLYAADLTDVQFKPQTDQADIAGRMVKILSPGE